MLWFSRNSFLGLYVASTAFVLSFSSVIPDLADTQLAFQDVTDCSNSTHRWRSKKGSCFDEEAGDVPYKSPTQNPNLFGRYAGVLGLHPRSGICGPDETTCWIVNCCQPGETCGPINIGCQVSWSTIYTTTTTTAFSTITELVIPSKGVAYTTATVNSTAYVTSFNQITLPGEGLDTVIETSTVTTTTIILSAYTPSPITTTETVTQDAIVTSPPVVKRSENLLPRVDISRRSARTSYKTLTVYITKFFTAHATATFSNSIVEYTETSVITSVATRNQTHYDTPTAFTTSTQTVTETSTSYAYGSIGTPTRIFYITQDPSSIIAGKTPTNDQGIISTNPPGAYPPEGSSRKLAPGVIAGIVVGLILALALLGLLIFMLVCIRRKRRNRQEKYEESPYLPSPPSPQPIMTALPQQPVGMRGGNDSPVSPLSPVFLSGSRNGYDHKNGNGSSSRHGYGHGRKGSRASMVSITPVPEEDEDEDAIMPVLRTDTRNSNRRNSNDSGRSWGRGYGGRGGYHGRPHEQDRTRAGETDSPTNPAFRGVITSTYSDENLVPPHARDSGLRF